MNVLCLDLEGVLVPEIWEVIADVTGIEELQRTTRDVVDYDELMNHRLKALERHDISYSTIRRAIEKIEPFDGAAAFLENMRSRFQLAILSDTFYDFASPLMPKLGNPFLLCHRMTILEDRIVGYRLRQEDPKT
ncbi:MAG: bifunctional phosphoserine phosphatase/homoserine phosphotransferase ThrH, partial [Pseudomonadota bacterium]|nr:bifunctional phosphoserine phosphatase/homoserine phosphotransferase ThrH [Pseudomonadota bacterium]